MGTFCGDMRPNPFWRVSSSNVIYIRFISRWIGWTGSYFKLAWTAVRSPGRAPGPLNPTPAPSFNSSLAGCGGDYFVAENNFTMVTSPGFPTSYENNLLCSWTLTTAPHFRIALTFVTIDMEAGNCNFDRIEISDGCNLSFHFLVSFETIES